MIPEWPKLDPITNRKICKACWNTIHYKKNAAGQIVDACDGECDCVHRSEETWAAIEKQKIKSNRVALRKTLHEHLETSPLAAQNEVKAKKSKRDHA